MIKIGGGGNSSFGYGLLLTSAILLVALSSMVAFCYPIQNAENTTYQELENQYRDFTGSVPTSESVWCLTGIYSSIGADSTGNPYDGYGYTEDGWIYGVQIVNYNPSQYSNDADRQYSYSASYDGKVYKYNHDETKYNKHANGDLYGSVVMDTQHKSDIFFSGNNVREINGGFTYEFTGWRYVWQPLSEYHTVNADGDTIQVVPNKTSLSLIWYDFYGNSGLSGNLILSGNTPGDVAYLSSAMIVSAFDSNTSTSKFVMTFNGVDMNVYIKLDASKLAAGLTVEECYNLGFWSVMVSSLSVDTDSVLSTDYEFNPFKVFQTMIDLLTFHTEDYGITGIAAVVCSFVIVTPLMVGILVLGMDNYLILIMAGLYGVISAWNWGLFSL